MINYLIEFALVHLILFVAYKLLLQRETQLATQRIFILCSTILALVIPFIQLPNFTPLENINVAGSISHIMLPAMVIDTQQAGQSWLTSMSWYNLLFITISIVFTIRIFIALIRLVALYNKSVPGNLFGTRVRHLSKLETSFTFFSWIFVDKNSANIAPDILHHEQAHVKFGHSYDLLLLNLLTIPFWWLPSIWLSIRELKFIHEYQADSYTLGWISYKNYLQTLVDHSLKLEGVILTNSFNDIPITKRLKYMKQLKKKISSWKLVSLVLILSITGYTFSCQTQNLAEVDRHVEAQMEDGIFLIVEDPATPEGGMTAFYDYVRTNLKYPAEALEKGLSGKIFVEFVVQKDGSLANIKILKGIGEGCDEEAIRVVQDSPPWIPGKQRGIIIKQRLVLPITFKHPDFKESDLADQAKIQDSGSGDKIFLMVEDPASFDGGISAFYSYVASSIQYTDQALNDGISGKVFIEFVVNTNGTIGDVKILRGIGAGLDEEAKRVVEASPNWAPGKQKGHLIRQKMVLPITFKHPNYQDIDEYLLKTNVAGPIKTIEVPVSSRPTKSNTWTNFLTFLEENLRYTEDAKNKGIEGKVSVELLINPDGSIGNVTLLRGIDPDLDQEAKRILEIAPKLNRSLVGAASKPMRVRMSILFINNSGSKETQIRIEVPDIDK